ncbi:stage II sporulation protein P [Pseudogracilibacillus auburnensis]|uniref:Stage II sporulation protein P n=1 Tax=Pseudogracilibacillus auburnensis TaxID=1494959 RepID=A0A2V3VY56_9BACI|nr:stage II sporulation protein P [Pseudogracilibacillus auburnensis]MBO1003466.1 stage II sporulation protein P [Pseudogracilibacillus auburnensis]PXW86546.1 stage II sporulation protein P [Pseudogracilibacillus auburnensis]
MFQHVSNTIFKYFRSFYKQILIAMIIIILLFTTIGIITTSKPSSRLSSSIFSSWTSNVDQSIFSLMFSLENTTYDLLHDVTMEQQQISEMLFNLVTSIKMKDLKSFLGHELPGFSTYENRVIIAGEDLNEFSGMSHESGPPLEDILQERKAVDESEKEMEKKVPDNELTTEGRKVVFLYNSHNRESFLPHLPDESEPGAAYHKEVNITKVSDRLANALESYGIGSYVDDTDIMSVLHEKGWTYGKSYEASRPVVQEAISQNKDLQYAFDLHRDSLPRDQTTKEIDGKPYAQMLFVIGAENKNYEKNLALATELHYSIEEKYPGLSKGVITKEGPNSNGVYNQDLLENALLMEIGGYENTLEEMYRSIDVLAELFSEFFWDAEQVNN